jgi:hypothetical protein
MDAEEQDAVTLLGLLIAGFENNEVSNGYHSRALPMSDKEAAMRKFATLCAEAERWHGAPLRFEQGFGRQLALWPQLEIRQAGRAILVRVPAPRFDSWWHSPATWAGDPLRPMTDWIEEEDARC